MGDQERQQRTTITMNNQRTPPDRANAVRYGCHTIFGTAGDNDEKFQTRSNTSAVRFTTPDEDDSVRQPQRPRPPPKPPPLLPRRPKPGTGTNNITRQQHAKRTSGDGTKDIKTTAATITSAEKDKQEPPRPPPPPEPSPKAAKTAMAGNKQ